MLGDQIVSQPTDTFCVNYSLEVLATYLFSPPDARNFASMTKLFCPSEFGFKIKDYTIMSLRFTPQERIVTIVNAQVVDFLELYRGIRE